MGNDSQQSTGYKGKKSNKHLMRLKKLGGILRTGALASRIYHVLDDKKIIYMAMYKAACSSILASLHSLPPQQHYLDIHRGVGRPENVVFDLRYGQYPDYFKFTFVRNPLERLTSLYHNKYHTDLKLLENGTLKHLYYEHYLFGVLRKDTGFAGFAKRVSRIPNCLADRHFVSQYFLTRDWRGRPLLDHIGRFEELPEAYEFIREKYELEPLAHYNQTNKGNWMDFYDEESAKRMIRHYRKDIDAFGYRDEANALLTYVRGKK